MPPSPSAGPSRPGRMVRDWERRQKGLACRPDATHARWMQEPPPKLRGLMGELGKCLFVAICLMLPSAIHAQAQGADPACPHDGKKLNDDELNQILKAHQQWVEEWARSGSSYE